jgi:tetratricopeptide (TPR) repeat protein
MIDVELFGLRPGWHHVTNLLFHCANSVLVLLLFFRLTGALARSALVAALFALHPLHVESVAWISERKDVLSTFFFLLTLLAYAKYARFKAGAETAEGNAVTLGGGRTALCYATALAFFALGLLSKPMLVTLPFVLLLLDYWPFHRIELTREGMTPKALFPIVVEKIPFFLLAAVVSVVTYLTQKSGYAVADYLPFSARAANALNSYVQYLAKTVWPSHLAIYYPHPGTAPFGTSWPVLKMAAFALLLAMISVHAWLYRTRRPWLLTGWLWYLGTLVPVVGLIQVGSQAMADRYTYIPLMGIFLAVVWLGAEAANRFSQHRPAMVAVAVAIVALCGLCTHKQVGYWRNSTTLFQHTVSVTQNNSVAHLLLGEALMADHKTNQALAQFNLAQKYSPGLAEIYYEFGSYYEGQHATNDAIRQYEMALKYRPWLDLARRRLAAQFLGSGRREEALALWQESLRHIPDDAEAHINFGGILWQLGKKAEATSEYEEAVRLDPKHPVAHYNLGLALAGQGRLADAAAEYSEAVHLQPNYTEALTALGRTLTLLGRLSEAPAPFRQLAKLQPTNADFQVNLGAALFLASRTNEAAEAFAAARRLQPTLPHELVQKANLLLKQGQRDAAIARATTALRIDPTNAEARAFIDAVNSQPKPETKNP